MLCGCSVLESDRIDYKSATKAPTLEVPPDLTQLARDTRYAAPGAPVTASTLKIAQSTASAPASATAVAALGDVRIERAGSQRWLVVRRPADKLWEPIKEFWQENGFLLAMEQPTLGIMETDWAENRAKIPQDFIRNTLGKLLDSLYSTGERDKFRTRLETNAEGGTDIFISHRGMVEVYGNTQKDNTVWQPRPADPELEAEFLRRLMVKLGVAQERAQAILATGAPQVRAAQPSFQDGLAVLKLADGFDRAWQRVGLALDRAQFTVEDRDRSKGLYFVRYVAPDASKSEPGFFARWFGSAKTQDRPLQYRIHLASQAQGTVVNVQNDDGSPAKPEQAQRILSLLAEDLR
ncbi:MAG: outer membrane protein assembly factor BamC [Rhodoferax sp.]